MAITSRHATSHRIWKDASGNLNIGSSANADAFQQDISGNVTIEGDATITGTLTAQEFHTEFVSASIVFPFAIPSFGVVSHFMTFPTEKVAERVLDVSNCITSSMYQA